MKVNYAFACASWLAFASVTSAWRMLRDPGKACKVDEECQLPGPLPANPGPGDRHGNCPVDFMPPHTLRESFTDAESNSYGQFALGKCVHGTCSCRPSPDHPDLIKKLGSDYHRRLRGSLDDSSKFHDACVLNGTLYVDMTCKRDKPCVARLNWYYYTAILGPPLNPGPDWLFKCNKTEVALEPGEYQACWN